MHQHSKTLGIHLEIYLCCCDRNKSMDLDGSAHFGSLCVWANKCGYSNNKWNLLRSKTQTQWWICCMSWRKSGQAISAVIPSNFPITSHKRVIAQSSWMLRYSIFPIPTKIPSTLDLRWISHNCQPQQPTRAFHHLCPEVPTDTLTWSWVKVYVGTFHIAY